MWRRNGYSMMDQARVYREPRCRSQMLDQDVIMLQVAAANMDPDEFLINLLAKYQLIEWSGDDFDCSEDDSIRQVRLHTKSSIFTCLSLMNAGCFRPDHLGNWNGLTKI